MPSPTSTPSLFRQRMILLLAPLILATLLWCWLESDTRPPLITRSLALTHVREMHRAIGQLENAVRISEFEAANETFSRLAEAHPLQLLPVRNLAVGRYLAIRATRDAMENSPLTPGEKGTAIRKSLALADEAVSRLIQFAPGSATANFLAARVTLAADLGTEDHTRDGLTKKALIYLRKAHELDPANLAIAYAIYDIAKMSEDPEFAAERLSALKAAIEIDSGNIAIVRLYLTEQAAAHDPAIRQTIALAKATTTALRQHLLRTGQNLDPWKYLAAATTALDANDWPGVQQNAAFFDNIVRPQDYARADRLRCDPHSLEFLVHDFDTAFHERYRTDVALPNEPIPVTFKAFPHQPGAFSPGDCLDFRLVDFNLDDRLDVLLLQEDALVVYQQAEKGKGWEELLHHPLPRGYEQFLAADLYMVDNTKRSRKLSQPTPAGQSPAQQGPRHNTYMGVVLFGERGIRILRNNLDRPAEGDFPAFDTVEQPAGFTALRGVVAICPGDLDHDGDLDLAVSSSTGLSLWFNRGNMTYVDMSSLSTLPGASVRISALAAVDWDRDVDLDLLAIGPGENAFGILENHRHGQFRWRSLNASYPGVAPATDIRVAELDGNVSWDLVTAGPTGLRTLLTTTSRPGTVNLLRAQANNTSSTSHLCSCDYDNDGYPDMVCLVGQRLSLYRGSPTGSFTEIRETGLGDRADILGIRAGDLDRDGDLDLAILTQAGFELQENHGGNANHWLDIRIIGKDDEQQTGRVNHYGIGSMLEIQAGGKYQAQVVNRETTHFGLGSIERADLARMLLTNGIPQGVVQPAANQLIAEPQVTKGSCPFIYTWRNGSFEFLTDCLWGAPIGLQVAEGTTVPGRPWEYLAIRARDLHASDGVYRIKFTEELWEAAYFDHTELLVVDHPPNIDIYTNEKVGPASIAQARIHAVSDRHLPRRVTDQHGNSLSAALAHADGHFAKAYDTKYRQGLVDEHFVEIDLGPLPAAAQLKLFLTGWIQPTDTSLNIAFSQNPDLPGPRLPYVQALDAEGNWHTIMGYMGFPGGKSKTISVDLSAHPLPLNNRLRIVTSAEIYWDHIFFTTGNTESPMNVTSVPPTAAHLQYRGFSRRLERQPLGPELFAHGSTSIDPLWPPMHGNFTRYGNVLPLLTRSDDKMVILGSGDALLVEFAVPPATLPRGWTRDFILHTVGWDKDADLNTVYGQSVEPLPFQAMSSYPIPPTETHGDSRSYRNYLDRYQNRRQHPLRFWRYVQDFIPRTARQ